MDISQIGEFGLIDRLTEPFNTRVPSTILGVGDDAAILSPESGRETLVTTDLLLEGIHFDLMYCPLKHVGFKAVSVNVSDILAMNGTPEQITVSIGISTRFSVEDVEALYRGIHEACEVYGVDLVGGDTSSSLTGLTISVTAIGSVPKGRAVRRSGARVNDLICLSGNVGAAYMGLQLCEREKVAYDGTLEFQPKFEGREYILQRQLRPYARIDIVEGLRQAGIVPTAMIDVSDGVASELLHITKASGVGCRIYDKMIPIDYETGAMAEELNINVITAALNGGEDYELLFTVPLGMKDLVEKIEDVRIIGYITDASEGAHLVANNGSLIALRAQGHHFGENEDSPQTETYETVS